MTDQLSATRAAHVIGEIVVDVIVFVIIVFVGPPVWAWVKTRELFGKK